MKLIPNSMLELSLSASEVSEGANMVGLWSLGFFRSLHWPVADLSQRSSMVNDNWRGSLPGYVSNCALTEILESLEQWRPGGRERY